MLYEDVKYIGVSQNRAQYKALVTTIMNTELVYQFSKDLIMELCSNNACFTGIAFLSRWDHCVYLHCEWVGLNSIAEWLTSISARFHWSDYLCCTSQQPHLRERTQDRSILRTRTGSNSLYKIIICSCKGKKSFPTVQCIRIAIFVHTDTEWNSYSLPNSCLL